MVSRRRLVSTSSFFFFFWLGVLEQRISIEIQLQHTVIRYMLYPDLEASHRSLALEQKQHNTCQKIQRLCWEGSVEKTPIDHRTHENHIRVYVLHLHIIEVGRCFSCKAPFVSSIVLCTLICIGRREQGGWYIHTVGGRNPATS